MDGDCGAGHVCELRSNQPVCVAADDAPINVGESAPVSGTNQALGTGMKQGIELAFAEQNAAGGVRGRQLVLKFLDDAYDPPTAEQNTRQLVDQQVSMTDPAVCPSSTTPEPDGHGNTTAISNFAIKRGENSVVAMIGSVGTPTMVRAAPVALESGTVFFGAFTGAAKILRDTTAGPCAKYVFNFRASYAQEAQATVDLFKHYGVTGWQNLISFDQNDTFGDAGYNGLNAAYAVDYPTSPIPSGSAIARFRYTRNDNTSVTAQITSATSYLRGLLAAAPGTNVTVGVMMTDTYGAGAEFIQGLRTWQYDGQDTTLDKPNKLHLYFSNVSFVGPNSLAGLLVAAPPFAPNKPMTTDVVVSQVVPNYQSDTSDIVTSYNRAIAAAGDQPGFTSLEGYVAARIFIAGLLAHDGPVTPDSLIPAFENLPNLSLGIGAAAGFSATNHQYSASVWGTSVQQDGTFKNLYYWTAGQAIQFFE